MIAKLQNPLLASLVGIALSVALGVGASWRTLERAVAQAAAARQPKPVNELKQRGWDFWTIEIENLSNELKEERSRLKKEAETLDQRAARVAAEEKEFARLRADVESLRREIAEKVIEISADEAVNLRKLSQTYANLSPRAVVAIVREMDDSTAVKILSLMKPDVVGPIFEEMSRGNDTTLAKRAALLSEKLRLMKAKPVSAS
jgi:flagellar motility protein MotE (MotC chaperone)